MFFRLKSSTALFFCLGAQTLWPAHAEAAGTDALGQFHHKQWQAQCGPDYCKLTPRAHPILTLARAHTGGAWALSVHDEAASGTILIDGVEMGMNAGVEMDFPAPLIEGDVLEIHYDAEGFSEGVSLAGIKAALIWVEEQQGQGGARRFMLHRPDWAALQAEARALTEAACEGPLPDMFDNVPQVVLGAPELLVLAQTCWTAAYNVGSHVYLLGPVLDGVDPVRVAAVDPDGNPVPELALWGIEGDTQVLDSFYKGRGLGDCFTHETYRFDGFNYDLERRVVDDACDQKIIPHVVWPE